MAYSEIAYSFIAIQSGFPQGVAAQTRPPCLDGYERIRLFGSEAIRLFEAHAPWTVDLVNFQQHLLLIPPSPYDRSHIAFPEGGTGEGIFANVFR